MSVVPGSIETGQQPPMTIPLRHFVLALGFLLLGSVVGLGVATGALSPWATLAHVHLLLVGWICLTIMGAMTQFVPVWSGTQLHSRRLASIQLWAVAAGLVGFAGALLAGTVAATLPFGGLMLLGFWLFVYNVGRTLGSLESWDVTERHFALALGFFVLVTGFGFVLALDFVQPVFALVPVTRPAAVQAHATLAVFGAVLTTVFGALYQLGTMFTQTELHGVDVPIRRFEEIAYPVGVFALAGGRLANARALALLGGLLVVASLAGVGVVLARRLWETQVAWTPMLSRYAVVALATVLWALATFPAWLRDPLSARTLFGAPGTAHLLAIGVVGFVVLGTLYHIVPFIVWVHRYSDLLGYEDVPMIDDLYDDRIATADLSLFVAGGVLLSLPDWAIVPDRLDLLGGVLLLLGTLLFLWNMLSVVRNHSPHSLVDLLVPWSADDGDPSTIETSADPGSKGN